MRLTKKNPDTRPLPPGWSQHYSEQQKVWYYVQNDVVPTRTSYVHPSGPDLNQSMDRHAWNKAHTEPAIQVGVGDQSSNRARNTVGPSFAQQLYASSMKTPASPAPSGTSSTGSRSVTPRETDSQRPHRSLSINLDTPAPPPIVAPGQGKYPPQLVTYLATSANPGNSSHPNNSLPSPSRSERFPLTASVTASVIPSPDMPKSTQPVPTAPSRAALLYNSAITPHNTQPLHRPRAGSHSSRPSSSRATTTSAESRNTIQSTSSASISAPSHHSSFPSHSNDSPHRTRSYQPVSSQPAPQSAVLHSRSATFHGVATVSPTSPYSSAPSAPPAQVMAPPVAANQRFSAPTALLTKASSPLQPPPPPPTLPEQSTHHVAPAQYHVSGSQPSMSLSSYMSPPTNYPAGLTSLPQRQPSSYVPAATPSATYPPPISTTSSFPPTPGLASSTSTQPSTPLYSSVPPTPQAAAPTEVPTATQPASQSRGFGFGKNNAMFGLAAGAATGIIGGVVLNNLLGGDDGNGTGDMSGLIDGMGNMFGGGGDTGNSGGMLDGIFSGDGTDASPGGGDNSFQPFDSSNQNNGPYVDSSNQGSPYYDPSDQGNGLYFDPSNQGGSDPTSGYNQSTPSDQQQQGQQQSGPNYMHMAHQVYNKIHNAQQQQQQTQQQQPQHAQQPQQYPQHTQQQQQHQQPNSSWSGGHFPAGSASSPAAGNYYGGVAGGAYQTHYGQMPGGAQQPQHNTIPGYQVAHAYHNPPAQSPTPHGQAYNQTYQSQVGQPGQMNQQHQPGPTSQYAQAGQHQQPLFGQDGKIKPAHVKQFAKGALIAGGLLAKLNGVNLNNNN